MTRGLAREGFDKDLLFGLVREDAFMRTLMVGAYIEHKSDQKARDTGRLFIEYETSSKPDGFGEKKPSGIAVTTSERWATEFADDCWILMPTARMRELMAAVHPNGHVWAGDNNRFHGALVSWRWILTGPPAGARPDSCDQLTL